MPGQFVEPAPAVDRVAAPIMKDLTPLSMRLALGGDGAGADAIGGDAVRGEFCRQPAREADDADFGHRLVRAVPQKRRGGVYS